MPTTETNTNTELDADAPLRIEKLVYGGDGLARAGRHVVFVPYSLPGESVKIAVQERKAQHVRATIQEILEPSPHRVAPPCQHFTACGGCHYQQADYGFQVESKLAILRETLQRVGKITPPEAIDVITGPPLEYRNRAQFHVQDNKIGYHEEGSRIIQGIEHCHIISPKLHEAFDALRKMMRDRRWPNFLRTVELFTNETDVQLNVLQATQPLAKRFFGWCAEEISGFASSSLNYPAGEYNFRVSHDAFFQINRFLIGPLVEAALQGAEGERALDLYSGVGLFSLPLARIIPHVTAVENGVPAWHDIQFNAQTAGVQIEALQTSAEDYLATAQGQQFDFVLADPPRAGLGKRAVASLLKMQPKRLTIVSCDPATLARDLAALMPTYGIEGMTLIDLFPQTYHLETVVRLRL